MVCSSDIDYAFLGGLFPLEMEEIIKIKSKGPIQNAANALQWNIINGIESNTKTSIKLFNLMFIGSYPKRYKDFYIKSSIFSHSKGSRDINIGFINITVLKQLLLSRAPRKHLKKWIENKNSKKKVLLVYSTNFLECIPYVKKINPEVHICLILPDLPRHMNMDKQRNPLYNMFNSKKQQMLEKYSSKIDSFVLLTDEMKSILEINNKHSVVIEGMVNLDELVYSPEFNNNVLGPENVKFITYTGTLTKKYGVLNLVEAFNKIDDESLRLVICGAGETENEIAEYAKRDKRILFKGIVPRKEAMDIQKNSTMLVNPRQDNDEYTKFSFPSKTLEYMLAGKPVVCYKLSGIPDDYDGYLSYVNGNDINSLKNKIIEICSKDDKELLQLGTKNREFVIQNKNTKIQTRKIVEMLELAVK